MDATFFNNQARNAAYVDLATKTATMRALGGALGDNLEKWDVEDGIVSMVCTAGSGNTTATPTDFDAAQTAVNEFNAAVKLCRDNDVYISISADGTELSVVVAPVIEL